jgi:triosephosphate isomerase
MASKIPRALIGGNWKCNGTLKQVRERIQVLNKAVPFPTTSEVVIATPSLHLPLCKELFHPSINVAAQDVGFKKGYGAFTGEMSAEMLTDAGINWTLTGHSERRVGFGYPGEPNSVVAIKTKNAIDAGMSVIFCLGEHVSSCFLFSSVLVNIVLYNLSYEVYHIYIYINLTMDLSLYIS